jgi:protein SCO1/2
MRHPSRDTLLAAAAATLLVGVADVSSAVDLAPAPRIGARIDPGLTFANERSERVTLGSLFDGSRPVLLTFNYFRCHGMCDLQLMHLAAATKLAFRGRTDAVRVVSVSFDPRDTPEDARSKRQGLLGRAAEGQLDWALLTGSGAAVAQLGSTLGATFRYDAVADQYAHAPLTFVLSPNGVLMRHLEGVDFVPRDLRLAVADAATGRSSVPLLDRVLLSCFQYDPAAGRYSLYVLGAVRVGGVLTLAALGSAWLLLQRKRRPPGSLHATRSAT